MEKISKDKLIIGNCYHITQTESNVEWILKFNGFVEKSDQIRHLGYINITQNGSFSESGNWGGYNTFCKMIIDATSEEIAWFEGCMKNGFSKMPASTIIENYSIY